MNKLFDDFVYKCLLGKLDNQLPLKQVTQYRNNIKTNIKSRKMSKNSIEVVLNFPDGTYGKDTINNSSEYFFPSKIVL